MKKYIKALVLILIIGLPAALSSQEVSDSKPYLKEANPLIVKALTEFTHSQCYELIDKNMESEQAKMLLKDAQVLLEKALPAFSDNGNINFKLGLCYYFSTDKQLEALQFFKKAALQVSNSYDFNSPSESKAPIAAYYFLASSYIEANQPDSALKYFILYKDKNQGRNLNSDREIEIAFNIKENERKIRNVQVKNMGKEINSGYAEKNPVISIDNKVLFFSSNRPSKALPNKFSEDIYWSIRDAQGNWSVPVEFSFNTEFDECPLFLTVDAKTLYLRRNIKGNLDIFISKYEKGAWTKPEAFEDVNTPFNEQGITFTAEGNRMFLSSDQDKENGKFDIYECSRDKNQRWTIKRKLPLNINTFFNETSPFVTPDGLTLFFCSDGFENKGSGGYDIYYSEMQPDNSWSTPVSMGYPINTTRNDVNYYIASENKRYYSRLNGENSYDLFFIEGGGFDFESIAANMEVVTVTNEMGVSQLLETEKEVEKEVEVIKTIETEVVVEKEVEVKSIQEDPKEPEIIHSIEEEKELKFEVKEPAITEQAKSPLLNLEAQLRDSIVNQVKNYLAAELKQKDSFLFKTIYFPKNKSNLSAITSNELLGLVKFMSENPDTKLEVTGNTDNSGHWENNMLLSKIRAREVYEFLLNNKISRNRMYYYGKGSVWPTYPNDTEENRSKNRRVDLTIIK